MRGLLWGALLTLAPLCAAPKLRLHYQAEEFPNLVYQVECLAGVVPCSRTTYAELWKNKLQWKEEDDRQIDNWRQTVLVLSRSAPYSFMRAAFPPNYAKYYVGDNSGLRARTAAYQSKSLAELQKTMKSMNAEPELKLMSAVLDHFRPRFHSWWTQEGQGLVQGAETRLAELAEKREFEPFTVKMAQFYEADLPSPAHLYFQVMARPESAQQQSSDARVENHVLMEFKRGDNAERHFGSAAYAVFQYFYDIAPPEKHRALVEEFRFTAGHSTLALYSYLNEAVATAAAAILDKNSEHKPERLHAHPLVDRLAKASIPVVEKSLEERKSIFQGFAEAYVAAAQQAFGPGVDAPRLQLAHCAFLGDPKAHVRAMQRFANGLAGSSISVGKTSWHRFPDLNAVVFLTAGELEPFAKSNPDVIKAGTLAKLQEFTTKHAAYIYSTPRTFKSRIYFLVVRDEPELEKIAARLLAYDREVDGLVVAE
jgi:hypothetical protein